jgi:hypothetical protein
LSRDGNQPLPRTHSRRADHERALLITLPEELVERLLVRATEAGYPDVSADIASVVRSELGESADTPLAFEPHMREQIRAKLREALA